MTIEIATLVSVTILVGSLIVSGIVSIVTFRRSRETSFRRNLRLMGYTEREIDRAAEEQGW